MRILHVLPNAGQGGVQHQVARLAAAQRRVGHDVGMASADGPLRGLFGDPWLPLPVARRDPLSMTRLARRVRNVISTWRPDIVNGHTVRLAPVVSLATLGGRSTPAVITAHGMPSEALDNGARLLRVARLPVVAVGPGLHAALAERGVSSSLIPNGVSPAPPPADGVLLRKQWDIPPDAPLVVAVGRLVDQKNHILAVRALPFVPRAVLVVVGEGPLRQHLEAEARRLAVEDRVRLVGFRPDARAIMGAADVVVMPSVWEGFGVAALEALSAGTPLVVTSGFGLAEWLTDGHDSLIISAEDPAALAGAVRRVLNDGRLAARLAAGGGETAARYSIETTTTHTLDLYSALLESPDRRSPRP